MQNLGRNIQHSLNPNYVGVYRGLFCGRGRGNITSCLKLEKICQGLLSFADVSIFIAKIQHFLAKIVNLLKAVV